MHGAIRARAICTLILGSKSTRDQPREFLQGAGGSYCLKMKIRKQISNSLIQLTSTVLAQHINYNVHAITLLEHVNSTLKRGKKQDLPGTQ